MDTFGVRCTETLDAGVCVMCDPVQLSSVEHKRGNSFHIVVCRSSMVLAAALSKNVDLMRMLMSRGGRTTVSDEVRNVRRLADFSRCSAKKSDVSYAARANAADVRVLERGLCDGPVPGHGVWRRPESAEQGGPPRQLPRFAALSVGVCMFYCS